MSDDLKRVLREKSYRTLELPRVLDMLAAHAVSDAARAAALSLRPAETVWEAERRQEETTAARRLLGTRGSPGFSGVRAVGGALARAEAGGVLQPRELLDIAALLGCARSVKQFGGQDEAAKTALDHLFAVLRGNKYLEEKILTVLLSEDEIADQASPQLADIRRRMRSLSARAREKLQSMVTSPAYAKCLQEPIVTIRGGRFVIPVKSEHRGEIHGLVHDVSSSGATLFIEPSSVVEMGNQLRELAIQEKNEIERILAELSAEAAAHGDDIAADYEALAALDLIFAKGKLSWQLEAGPPALTDRADITLVRARHPLIDPKKVVPITVRLGREFDTLIITGPNTGGKTVALKTLGLLALMAACGLHLPADDGSEAGLFEAVLADIGDEQSIEQSLSTFSAHMTNIVSILAVTGPSTLALFDELGAGTDPVEGAALAQAIIQHTRALGARVAATTHYAELKAFAIETAGVENASCEFDVDSLQPTYRLLIGIPGKSNAFAISRRLGLGESVIEAAKAHVGAENAGFEDILTKLETERQAMERMRIEADAARREAEEINRAAKRAGETLRKDRDAVLDRARAEARLLIEQARMAADEALSEARDLQKQAAEGAQTRNLGEARAELRRRLREADDATGGAARPEERPPPKPTRPLVPGDTVELLSLGAKASVLAVQGDTLSLQAGLLKVTVKADEVRLAEEQKITLPARPVSAGEPRAPRMAPAVLELDLRGLASDEALLELDRFLDGAILSGMHTVTVIHGKGTGVLRQAVQAALRTHRQVEAFRLGKYGEGEQGVTIVTLK
ncbi:MAG: endonuclease MutS2 [Oscillospiraceae bacterium]|jgi:DNA mismatch repair protein MutS2|nr:endonuclease MutS2 [Oscillospiraceae bacterium]